MRLITLRHYFLPHHSNNHRAKLLHDTSLLALIFIFVIYQAFMWSFPAAGARVLGYAANISPQEVVSLTNLKRVENGTHELVYSTVLAEAAKKKGEDMLARDYWAHVAPDGTQPWKFFIDEGYAYRYAGENLARDFSNANAAVDAWIASPSHRDNLLSSKYTEIGIAVVEGDLDGADTTLIVQLFGTRQGETDVPAVAASSDLDSGSNTAPQQVFDQPSGEKIDQISESMGVVSGSNKEFIETTISSFTLTKGLALLITGLLLIVLVTDGVVASHRKTPRMVGRHLAHIAFIGMIFSIVLLARAGNIL